MEATAESVEPMFHCVSCGIAISKSSHETQEMRCERCFRANSPARISGVIHNQTNSGNTRGSADIEIPSGSADMEIPSGSADIEIPSGIWSMPVAARRLAEKVRDKVIIPAQTQLASIHLKFQRETDAARQDLGSVKDKAAVIIHEKFEGETDAVRRELASVKDSAAAISAHLDEVFQQAWKKLQDNNIPAERPAPPPLPGDTSSTEGNVIGGRGRIFSSRQHIAEAGRILAGNRELVGSVLEKAKPPDQFIWPNGSMGCGFAIGLLVVALLGAAVAGFGGFLVMGIVTYLATMIYLHTAPRTILKKGYAQIVEDTALARWHTANAIIASKKEAQDPLNAAENTRQNALASLDAHLVTLAKKEHDLLSAAEDTRQNALAALKARLIPLVNKKHDLFVGFARASGFAGAQWNDTTWDEWQMAVDPEFGACLGRIESVKDRVSIEFPELALPLTLPVLHPFAEGRGILFVAPTSHRDPATHAVQSLLARLLATVPSGKFRMTFIDPVSLGAHVAAFMALADYEESLINSRAWTEPQHIEEKLAEITEHMETVIQKYLRTEFKTIHDYNAAAGEVAEPFRFVVVFDFPVNFTESAFRRLVSIARNGARCGVYVIIVRDPSKPLPYGFEMTELEQLCEVIEPSVDRGTSFQWRSPAFQAPWLLHLDPAPPENVLSRIIQTVGEQAKLGMRVEVPYDKLLSLANLGSKTWWSANTINSIRIPLGPTGARKLQYLTLGEAMGHHALIVGRPGSGKSNLMHVIITTLALAYSPDEMRVYLIDFKKGVEFKSYADHKLPHAEAIAVESEREFGLSVVERLDVELKKRGDLFRTAGVANITEYRGKTNVQLPRILLLVDEFQEFFTQDDHVARQTTLVLDRLVRQGRAFGIHIILGSQTLAGSYNLSRSTLDQMAVRIAMQCSEADSRLILSDDNPAARLLSRPGEAIYNASSGLVEGNNLFQVARFSDEDREERLKLVGRIARDSDKPVPIPIIFEGNELAHLTGCRKLVELLDGNAWPTKRGLELLLGDPIAIRDPIAARIRRQSGSHLLILSRDEAEGVGMCVASILSILAQQPPGAARVFIADFTLADSEWAERAEEIEEFFPHDVKVLSRQKDVAETIKNIADEVKRRIDVPPEESSIYLVLQGMQRIKVLRAEDESFSYENDSATPSELFAMILRDGPEVGVHVIAWCDTYPNAGRVANRRMITDFGLRAGGVMSADDSQNFFDDPIASKIDKAHRVIFFDEERPGQLDKFRPYSMPPREWLEMTGLKLRDRTNHQT